MGGTPLRVPYGAHAVAGQVQAGTVLPIRPEDSRNAGATARPAIERKWLIGFRLPGPRRRRLLGIVGAVEAKPPFLRRAIACRRRDGDQRERPGNLAEPPSPKAGPKEK